MDLPDVQAAWPEIAHEAASLGVAEPMAISAVAGEGVEALLRRTADTLAEMPGVLIPRKTSSRFCRHPRCEPDWRSAREDMRFTVARDVDGAWRVQGATSSVS